MQYILPSLLAIVIWLPLAATPQEEIATLEQLIETTTKNLENQRTLLKCLRAYSASRQAYLGDPDNGKLATALVKRAITLQTLLIQEHLSHLFAADFLSEIAFYNQVGRQYVVRE